MADKNLKLTSPAGTARYPWLHKADFEYGGEHGSYKVDLILPEADKTTKAFVKKLKDEHDRLFDEDKRKKKSEYYPVTKELDENEKPTGNVIVKFKVNNVMTKKGELWERQPKQFDAAGTYINKALPVGAGSTLKVNFEVRAYPEKVSSFGITLQLNAVQILDLVEFGGGNAEDFGFGAEDGFVTNNNNKSDESFENGMEAADEGQDEDLY